MRKVSIIILILIIVAAAMKVQAQYQAPKQTAQELDNPQIDFPTFITESEDVYAYRKDRRVSVKEFMDMAKDENTIILDTRSKSKYKMMHVKGAVHLNFSDFTEEDLAKVIPSKDTRILIYCNNNFIVEKPKKRKRNWNIFARAFPVKGRILALNIPTFINLYGYGYKNIYELEPAVDPKNTALEFKSL